MQLVHRLLQRRLIVVTGKGGVGKSAFASVLGCSLARRGRRALVLEVDPRENLHQMLGVAPSGGEIVPVRDRLYLQNLKPRQVVDWVVKKQVRIKMLVERVLRSPIYHRFVEGAPGLTEVAILGHAMRLARGDLRRAPKVDVVILDAPATGHGVYLLTAPKLFAETIGEGPFAELASEVAGYVADPEVSGLAVVTLAEELPVQEALELRRELADRLDRQPELLIANGLYPKLAETADTELAALWRQRRELNVSELERLSQRWSGPRIDLPLLPIDRGVELVDSLAEHFDEALDHDAALDQGVEVP
ncbi:MAG: ArsA-related P-loop ATPase [Acidobacteriota bacterium]